MKAFLCELVLSCTLALPTAKPVDELTYGTMLYAYHQQDYEQALLEVLVAERQGRRGDDLVRFELAKGSFAFADGLYGYARETFAGVARHELTELDEMRLAFHLAREYYRLEDWASLGDSLQKIDLGRRAWGREVLHPEVEFMRAERALHGGDLHDARLLMERMDEREPLRAFGLFNLGVAYRQAGDLTAAEQTFSELAGMRATNAEVDDLIQRGRLALAFIAREGGNAADAEAVLSALPGSGRYRDLALASYAGMAMDTGDFELAARIWMALQNQPHWTTSTARARLGFPMSLEQLASTERALVQYRLAEQSFQQRLVRLTELQERARNPSWVHELLLTFSAPERRTDQMGRLMEQWQEQLGHTDWLEWLASDDVHQVLMEWRDLLEMRSWLDGLPTLLEAYEEISGERRRRGAVARQMLGAEGLLATQRQLQQQVAGLQVALGELRSSTAEPGAAWMILLADDAESELIGELVSMRTVASAAPGDQRDELLRRIERLQGVLFWRLAYDRDDRQRQLEKRLNEATELLADIDGRVERLRSAEAVFMAGVHADFLNFQHRADLLTVAVTDALQDRETRLAAEILRGMQREAQEVQGYLLASRVAIARATDLLAQSDGIGSDVIAETSGQP